MTTFKDLRPTWADCSEAEDYVVLSPRDLVFRPDIIDETHHLLDFCSVYDKMYM